MANGTFSSGLLNCLFEDFFTSKNISSNLQKITCITLNLQYIDVQGDSMYSILSIDATYFLNITKGHYPQRMPIIYKPRTRYNATSGIQSAITVADPPSGYGGSASQHYRSHAETDLLGIMIIQPGHQVVLCAGNRKDAGHPGRKKKCEACSFHLCYYQLEPVGSITSRQAYGAGMPAILIICRW